MKKDLLAVIIAIIIFSFLFSLISIQRHENFQSQGWDLALFDQIIWLYSQGKTPYSTLVHRLDPADRFRPILLLLVPLYWIKEDVKILLIAQAIVLTSGIFPTFLLAKKILKSSFAALSISISYVLFAGIQSYFIDDFHEVAFLPPLLLWLFYAFFTKRKILLLISLLLCLMVREHVGFFLLFIGIYLLLISKKEKKEVLTIIFTSLIWTLLAIWVIIPKFGEFRYMGFGKETERLDQTIINYLTKPVQALKEIIQPPTKITTVFLSFAAFAFFPIVHLPILIPIAFQFLSRFLDRLHPYRWTPYYHYSGEVASLMVVGTIFAFKRISFHFKKSNKIVNILSFTLLTAVVLEQVFLPVSLKNLAKKSFYQKEAWMTNNKKLIQLIPKESSVATQNNLAPHLSQREKIYILPEGIGADFVLVDTHPNQNPWNFYTLTSKEIVNTVNDLVSKENYFIFGQKGDALLLKKGKGRINS